VAKKSKANLTPTLAADSVYKPSLYLDLEGKDVTMVKELKVGETVEFCVRGKIRSLEQRQRTDEKGKEKTTGSISLENYEVELMEEEANEFSKLAEDD